MVGWFSTGGDHEQEDQQDKKTNYQAFLQLLPPGAMECVCKPRGRLLLQIVQNAPRRDKTTH